MALKVMALLLVAAFVGLFFIDGPNGQPIVVIDDFIPEVPQSLDEIIPSSADLQPTGPTKVYKWKDENGIWQFSNRKEDSVDIKGNVVDVMELDGDINIMPAVDILPAKVRNAERTTKKADFSSLPTGLTTVAPDKIGEMMDTVNNLQDTVDQRKQDLDKIMDGNN
ncbi:MAG: hypothetical protein JKY88_11695 [Pseudomonadales bacterium]|nr:hypothetical protein [Pseudomonadales bacterium]